MSGKKNALSDLTAKLGSIVVAPERSGKAEADKALAKAKGEGTSTKSAPPKPKAKPPEKKKPVVSASHEVAKKITLSLHPADLERLDEIEEQMKKAGVPTRGVGLSFLVKLGIAGFKSSPSEITKNVAMLKGQDCRRKP